MEKTGVGSLGSHYGNQYLSSYNPSYIRCAHVVVMVALCLVLLNAFHIACYTHVGATSRQVHACD